MPLRIFTIWPPVGLRSNLYNRDRSVTSTDGTDTRPSGRDGVRELTSTNRDDPRREFSAVRELGDVHRGTERLHGRRPKDPRPPRASRPEHARPRGEADSDQDDVDAVAGRLRRRTGRRRVSRDDAPQPTGVFVGVPNESPSSPDRLRPGIDHCRPPGRRSRSAVGTAGRRPRPGPVADASA